MELSRRKLRSLRDIRTLSGKVDEVSNPYMAYMRISILEMEKVRRGKERESAMELVRSIDARFREIEEEKADLLRKIEESGSGVKDDAHDGARGFKIRY